MTTDIFNAIMDIDGMITDAPDADRFDVFRKHNNIHFENYLFEHLSRTDWLPFLNDQGEFAEPSMNGAPYRFGYLKRLAPEVPFVIAALLSKYRTLEPDAKRMAIEAACALPPEAFREVQTQVVAWIHEEDSILLTHPLTDYLVLHAPNRQFDTMIRFVTTALLTPWQSEASDPTATYQARQPRSHLSQWQFKQFLDRSEPIVRARTWYLPMVCQALAEFAALRQLNDSEASHYAVWRRTLEPSRDTVGRDLDFLLIDLLADRCRERLSPRAVNQLWRLFSSYPYTIFRRLRLHLLTHQPQAPAALVREALMDHPALEAYYLEQEYRTLAQQPSTALTTDDLHTLMGWVQAGPQGLAWLSFQPNARRHEADSGARWEWHKLNLFGQLPEPWQARRAALNEMYSGPPDPTIGRLHVRSGESTSFSAETFHALDLPGMLQLLQADPPSTGDPHFDRLNDRVEGLSGLLRADVRKRPSFYLEHLTAFQDVSEEYQQMLLYALRTDVSDGVSVLLNELLDYFDAVNRHADAAQEKQPWSILRGSLSDLFADQLLQRESVQRDTELAPRIAAALIAAYRDPDPVPDVEDPRFAEFGNAFDRSLNVTRGKVMHALLAYIVWMTPDATGGSQEVKDSVERIKATVLEALRTTERSSAVWAAFTGFHPWFNQHEPAWYGACAAVLFDREQPELSGPVWEAHLHWNKPYTSLLRTLRPHYLAYTDEDLADPARARWPVTEAIQKQFVERLAIFYLRGTLTLENQEGLLRRVILNAMPEAVGHLVSHIGRVLEGESAGTDPEIIQRAMALWDELKTKIVAERPELRAEVLSNFSWWFISGAFALDWVLPEFSAALTQATGNTTAPLVLDRLSTLVLQDPERALPILTQLVAGGNLMIYELLALQNPLKRLEEHRSPTLDGLVNTLVDQLLKVGLIDQFLPFHRNPLAT